MSNLLRTWYILIALGLLSFALSAFIGKIPYQISANVAIPTQIFFRAGANIRNAGASLADRRDLQKLNLELNSQLAELKKDNRRLELELQDLTDLLQVRESISPGAKLVAPIIGISSDTVLTSLTIGKGSKDGIRVDMPVTSPDGLVGLVTGVVNHKSSVRAITDPQSRVGISVRGGGGQGVVIGVPGDKLMVIDFIEEKPVKLGDIIETRSLGGLFPQGITVGVVSEIPIRDPNDLRIKFALAPAVNIRLLEKVVLIQSQ